MYTTASNAVWCPARRERCADGTVEIGREWRPSTAGAGIALVVARKFEASRCRTGPPSRPEGDQSRDPRRQPTSAGTNSAEKSGRRSKPEMDATPANAVARVGCPRTPGNSQKISAVTSPAAPAPRWTARRAHWSPSRAAQARRSLERSTATLAGMPVINAGPSITGAPPRIAKRPPRAASSDKEGFKHRERQGVDFQLSPEWDI